MIRFLFFTRFFPVRMVLISVWPHRADQQDVKWWHVPLFTWKQTLKFISTQSHIHRPSAEQRWQVTRGKNKLNWAIQIMWLTPVCFSFYAGQKSDSQMWLNGFTTVTLWPPHGRRRTFVKSWDCLGLYWPPAALCSALSLLLRDMYTGMCVFVCALMADKLDWMDAHFLTTVNSTCTKMGWSCREEDWLSERHNEQLFFRASHHLKCYLWSLSDKHKNHISKYLYIFHKNFIPISLKLSLESERLFQSSVHDYHVHIFLKIAGTMIHFFTRFYFYSFLRKTKHNSDCRSQKCFKVKTIISHIRDTNWLQTPLELLVQTSW